MIDSGFVKSGCPGGVDAPVSLQYKFRGENLSEVMALPVAEARTFFPSVPAENGNA